MGRDPVTGRIIAVTGIWAYAGIALAMTGSAAVAWIILALAAVAMVLVITVRPRPRGDGDGIEALIEATREGHPQFRDWDIRELTDR